MSWTKIRHLASHSFATPAEISSPATTGSTASGPKQDRPAFSTAPGTLPIQNQFGTNEFLAWCKAVGTEPLMGLNFGTGTANKPPI